MLSPSHKSRLSLFIIRRTSHNVSDSGLLAAYFPRAIVAPRFSGPERWSWILLLPGATRGHLIDDEGGP